MKAFRQDLHLAQHGISNQSRAMQVQFGRNKSIAHELALTSRECKPVLIKLIQVSQKQPKHVANTHFAIKLYQAIINARG